MAWERGYYYRVRRENGRVVREYVGSGQLAELMAKLDTLDRKKGCEERRLEAEALRNEKAEMDALDANLESLIEITDLAGPRGARGRRLSSAQARGMEKTT